MNKYVYIPDLSENGAKLRKVVDQYRKKAFLLDNAELVIICEDSRDIGFGIVQPAGGFLLVCKVSYLLMSKTNVYEVIESADYYIVNDNVKYIDVNFP